MIGGPFSLREQGKVTDPPPKRIGEKDGGGLNRRLGGLHLVAICGKDTTVTPFVDQTTSSYHRSL